MAINFPASPTDGQTYTENGVKWKYNSAYTAWLVVDTPILANTSSGQVLYNYNDTIVSSNGISFSTEANTLYVNNINVTSNITTGNVIVGNTSVNTTISSSSIVTGSLSVNGDNVSPVQSFRNKIINGNFDFWQRGTSVTGVTSGQFVTDRFKTLIFGSTADVSRQSFTLGQTDVPNEPTYYHRTVVTSVAGSANYCQLQQRIESVRTLAGQTATLSFWAKADASKNIAVEFIQNFGAGGSSSVTAIDVTTCALTTSWQKFTVTVSIPSISGKTIGTNNDSFFSSVFYFDAGSDYNSRTNSLGQQSGTFDIAQVQLEAGSVATPFEVRLPGVELALCQRYYQKSYPIDVSVGSVNFTGIIRTYSFSLNGVIWSFHLPVEMRATPSVASYSYSTGSSGNVRNDSTSTDISATASGMGSKTLQIVATASAAQQQLAAHWTADAEL